MKISDAAHILGLTGDITPEIVKQAYRKAVQKYHPDRNPAGLEMMKLVNAAFEVLKQWSGNLDGEGATTEGAGYPDAVSEALNAIIDLVGLNIEICGAWVWVDGETYKHRAALKEANFQYAPNKKRWYFRPEDWASSSRGSMAMDDIRDRYGSSTPHRRERRSLPAGSRS